MADGSSATSASGAPSDLHTPTPQTDTNADARLTGQPRSSKSSGNLEQIARHAAKTPQTDAKHRQDAGKTPQQAKPADDDDPEFDFDGEKYRKSQLADMAKRRREYDRASGQRFEEAARLRKEVDAKEAKLQAVVERFKQNPWELFEHAGLNPDELAEQRLAKALQRQQMSPEAIELEKAQAELARLKGEQEKFAEQQKQQKHEQQVKHWLAYFDKAIGTALETGGLPRTAQTAQRVRQAFEALVDAGHQIDDTTAALALERAKDEMYDGTQQLLGELAKSSPKMLVEVLGGLDGEIVKAVQRMAVDRHNATVQPHKPLQQQQPKPQPKPKAPPTLEEVRRKLSMA